MHYADNVNDMKTIYENRQLLARARKDYLKANPPKERPFIMNVDAYNKEKREAKK